MHRGRMLGVVVGALAMFAFALPSSALAQGTYTWNLASDFARDPGSNPGGDLYNALPWSYAQGSSSAGPFTPLTTPETGVDGGLSAWGLDTSGNPPVVGINLTGSAITNSSGPLQGTIQPGQVVVAPSASQTAAVGWTSPFSQPEQVTLQGNVDPANTSAAGCSTTWTIDDQNTNPSGSTGTGTPISDSVTVAPGATIYVALSGSVASAVCDAVLLSLQIQVPATPPAVTMTSPLQGSSSANDQPTFEGTASSGFGYVNQVVVSIYPGSAVSATSVPVETFTAPSSSGTWLATAPVPLSPGTYTAVGQQSDLAGDTITSPPVTFGVALPPVTLIPLSTQSTSTPTLTGTAGTDPTENASVSVNIYAGSAVTAMPIRTLTASVGPTGQFSVSVLPPLADGIYTATAVQGDISGTSGVSTPQTFGVDTHSPTVSLLTPFSGAKDDLLQLAFKGGAGTRPFDVRTVTVLLYRGHTSSGIPYRTITARVRGSTWSVNWSAMNPLPLGVYTARASQSDSVGHVGLSAPHTFRIVAEPPVIGAGTFTPSGRVTLPVACNEPMGDPCTGTVLVQTRQSFQTVAGGPFGQLILLYAPVRILGGSIYKLVRMMLPGVASALRRHRSVPVMITVVLHPRSGAVINVTVIKVLKRR